MNKRHRITIAALTLTSAMAFVSSASALPVLSGTDLGGGLWDTGAPDSGGRTASATFMDLSSGSFNGFAVTLSNNATSSRQPNQMLVGLIFEFSVDPGIVSPSSDSFGVNVTGNVVARGASLLQTFGVDYGNNLDGEFAFRDDLAPVSGGLGNYGISSSAYDPLGINPVINSAVSYPPGSTNGADFGIAAQGTTSPVSSIEFWVDGSVTMYFQTASAFNFANLSQVNFLYGTDFYANVPEPATLSLLGAGLIFVGFASRRRRKA